MLNYIGRFYIIPGTLCGPKLDNKIFKKKAFH